MPRVSFIIMYKPDAKFDDYTSVQYVISALDFENILRDVITEVLEEREEAQAEKYLSSNQTAKLLGVSKSTLWRWEKENYLVPIRVGNKLRYKESDVKHLMEE